MLDHDRMLKREDARDEAQRTWQAGESASNRRYRIAELVLVIITIVAVLIAAFIERGGPPTINNYIIPSTSGTGATPP